MAEDRHSAEQKGEYDYEGDMAKSQLKSIITNAQRMHDMLEETTNLPEWVQSKITLAEDYILTATSYMEGEMSEEYSIQEKINMVKAKMGDVVKDFYKSDAPQFAGRSKSKRRQMAVAAKLGAMRKSKMSEELKDDQHKIDANKNNKIDAHDFKLLRSKLKVKKEEVEQIGEAPYMGKGNHKPGWMLRADPKLAAKFKEIEDRKKRMKKNVGKTDDEIAKMNKEEVDLDEAVASNAEMAQRAHKAYIQATRQGNGTMAAQYAKDHQKYKKLAAIEKRKAVGEEVELDEAPYMGKGNHKPGWMLRADPELARKFKEIEDRKKRMNSLMKTYGGKTGDEIAKMRKEEASPMIKPPSNRFDNKKDAFAHAKKNGGKVYRHKYVNPRSGMESTTYSVKEEVEQVNELKKSTLGSYIKKASDDVATKSALTRHFATKSRDEKEKQNYTQARKDDETSNKLFNKSWKRRQGIAKAVDRLAKEEVEQVDEVIGNTTGYSDSGPRNKADERKFHQMRNVVTKGPRTGKITKHAQNRLKDRLKTKTYMEEVEQVNELKKSTLGSYLKKASKEYGRDKQVVGRESPDGTVAKARPEVRLKLKNRMRGIERAADRLAK
jgi:hypothetical protein